MVFDSSDLKKINKKLVGEMNKVPSIVRDEKLLGKIGSMTTKEAQAFSLMQDKPFESGNARTAFFVLYYHGDALSNRNVSNFIGDHRAWMILLGKTD